MRGNETEFVSPRSVHEWKIEFPNYFGSSRGSIRIKGSYFQARLADSGLAVRHIYTGCCSRPAATHNSRQLTRLSDSNSLRFSSVRSTRSKVNETERTKQNRDKLTNSIGNCFVDKKINIKFMHYPCFLIDIPTGSKKIIKNWVKKNVMAYFIHKGLARIK